ncbi:DNA repair protein RadA [Desulfofalx alkaliphila]|uniref:DNA repair protein RadA n=1 Tax=Desulfofalx alkaliphila TaxID=105483 RepID=UPI0004E16776|nr:DNA repair protein RadA [Desulfofalx alkaliphila]
MGKKSSFLCQECGHRSVMWMGRCPGCGSWNTLVEELTTAKGRPAKALGDDMLPIKLSQVDLAQENRYVTGIGELDRVLGGGVVPGSLILVGGDPGIGKSTLLLQAASSLSSGGSVLYITGEESLKQVAMRAKRLGIKTENLFLASETDIETAIQQLTNLSPRVAVIDSIQTMMHPEISSAPGSVSQVRESTARLMNFAKNHGIAIFIVGHVTKEGAIAGPRVLEHMVDTVLYFEGDGHQSYRILRAVKNRFGSTNELGIFEMQGRGLKEIANPSALFLERHPLSSAPGSVVVPSLEGTRPLLVEIQALVCPNSFGVPRRMTTGVDHNRVALIMAVLEKRVGLKMGGHDAYVNVVGGVRLLEPAVDLAVALALASSYREKLVADDMVVIGEIGLTGEVRPVTGLERRLKEAQNLGFRKALVPQTGIGKMTLPKMNIFTVNTLYEAIDLALNVKGGAYRG